MILPVRGEKVILDADLAHIYGVRTKRLNEQVKRNKDRFPDDFIFQLTVGEKEEVVANCENLARIKFSPALPYAFTEHGAIMAATILNSPRAVQMSVFVVRAFVRMRSMLSDNREFARQMTLLERHLSERLDIHESAIVQVLHRVMRLLEPPPEPPTQPKPSIGFRIKEGAAKYRSRT